MLPEQAKTISPDDLSYEGLENNPQTTKASTKNHRCHALGLIGILSQLANSPLVYAKTYTPVRCLEFFEALTSSSSSLTNLAKDSRL
jgi:hypothetical protein